MKWIILPLIWKRYQICQFKSLCKTIPLSNNYQYFSKFKQLGAYYTTCNEYCVSCVSCKIFEKLIKVLVANYLDIFDKPVKWIFVCFLFKPLPNFLVFIFHVYIQNCLSYRKYFYNHFHPIATALNREMKVLRTNSLLCSIMSLSKKM